MVHRREYDGTELVLGNQGALWGNAMTWWDHDTGSVWSQPIGEAIAGPRKGATLELVPSVLTSWESWLGDHPETVALNAGSGRSGFDLSDMAIVVEFGDEAAAYPIPDLREVGPANDVVAGTPIAVVVDPANPQAWSVFSRVLDDRTVTLAERDGRLIDVETETSWDPVRGIAVEGPLVGEILDLLPGFTSFVEDFFTFFPDGRVVRRR